MKKRYYTANIPADAYDTKEHGFELAVIDIKVRMKMHYIPCNWYLVWIKGDKIRVCLETSK
jgi:hypothetical protein